MLRVLCLLFVLSNSAIAFTPTPAQLVRPHLAPTSGMRPRIEVTRMRVEGGHVCGLRSSATALAAAMLVAVSPMICYPAVAVAAPVATEQRRVAVIGIIGVASPLGVAINTYARTEPPGPSQSSARSSRRRSPGETLQQWIGSYCTWKAFKSAHVEKYVWRGWCDTFRHVSLNVSELNESVTQLPQAIHTQQQCLGNREIRRNRSKLLHRSTASSFF